LPPSEGLLLCHDVYVPSRLLNLGSGPHYADGWMNVDPIMPVPPARPPDVFASLPDLPWENDHFERAYLGHVLEHLPWATMPATLAEVRRVVRPGGQVMAVGPCLLRAIARQSPDWLILAIVSDPRHAGDPLGHAWTPTETMTVEALRIGGFVGIQVHAVADVVFPEWPNPSTAAWQTAVSGLVP
jgi:hypothetical protein